LPRSATDGSHHERGVSRYSFSSEQGQIEIGATKLPALHPYQFTTASIDAAGVRAENTPLVLLVAR
jgi:hypothetical protein